MGEKLKITWAVVEASDEYDNMSVCAFEGDPADGIMADVICEITSLEEEKDARLIAAAPEMYEAAFALCNRPVKMPYDEEFELWTALRAALAKAHPQPGEPK